MFQTQEKYSYCTCPKNLHLQLFAGTFNTAREVQFCNLSSWCLCKSAFFFFYEHLKWCHLASQAVSIFGKLIEWNMVNVIAVILSMLIQYCPPKCSTHLEPVLNTEPFSPSPSLHFTCALDNSSPQIHITVSVPSWTEFQRLIPLITGKCPIIIWVNIADKLR